MRLATLYVTHHPTNGKQIKHESYHQDPKTTITTNNGNGKSPLICESEVFTIVACILCRYIWMCMRMVCLLCCSHKSLYVTISSLNAKSICVYVCSYFRSGKQSDHRVMRAQQGGGWGPWKYESYSGHSARFASVEIVIMTRIFFHCHRNFYSVPIRMLYIWPVDWEVTQGYTQYQFKLVPYWVTSTMRVFMFRA